MLSEVSGPAPSQKRKARSKHLARAQRRRVGDGGSYAGVRQVATIDADASAIPEATANFEAYYQAQCLFTNPADWDSFFQTLRQPLPVTFRVSTSSPFVRQCLDSGAPFLSSRATIYSQPWGSSHGVSVVPPERLDWCGAWQLGCSSLVLKNAQEPRLVALRRWLARWAALGVLTRQEIVSMIPVSFLDVQPGHHVLDMCAAPGSKTTQVLDILQQPGAAPGHGGVVVANDLDPRRGYMLVRRCAAMGLATSRLVVTQHKAQKFPDVSLFPQASPAGEGDAPSRVHPECAGLYDRIVCDVPCCGDGTLRKSPSVWQRWHPQFALGLHSIQLQIAMRGAALLKVGGRMAYSTCTFNPVENEAVVCELLRRCQGSMELVDVSDQHPEVRRAPGLRKWCVFDDEMTRYDTFEETQAKHIPPAHRRRFRRSMFPIPLGSLGAGQRRPPLRRCMRFYPHHQNTGGFFVCILRKVRPLPAGLRVARGNVPRPPRALVVAPQFRFLPAATSALAWLRTTFSIRKQHMPILERCLYSRSSTAGRYACMHLSRTPTHTQARTSPILHWHVRPICHSFYECALIVARANLNDDAHIESPYHLCGCLLPHPRLFGRVL